MSKPEPEWIQSTEAWSPRSTADFLASIARRWPFIVAPLLLGAVLAAGLAMVRPKYEASAFFYTPGWAFADLKRFRSEFGSADVLEAFLREAAPKDSEGAQLLQARALDPRFWEMSLKPLFPITRRDAKEVFESTKDREPASILGLDLEIAGGNPAAARGAVLLLGEYLTQNFLLTSLQNWVAERQAAGTAELLKVENQVLQTRYTITQSKQRVGELMALQTRYPESQRMEARQVVSADAASARYLSPIAQVVALESSVAESNESLRRMERRASQLKLESEFFTRAAADAKSTRLGWTLLERLLEMKREVFANKELADDAVREISNRFDLELKGFRDQYTIGFGFRSAVLEPSRSTRSPARFAAMGAAIGLLLGLGLVLAWAWWESDRLPLRGSEPQPAAAA
ncbi:MAG: hypothetical protein MUD07_04925 [Burkholderiaceae bacterium]|jgi:hypothetical protein|nr:hypothetical protein [Burkholderiaceae bacterium]